MNSILNKNNEIDISESQWIDLNKTLSKDEIKSLISDTIEKNNCSLPYRQISESKTIEDFYNLKNLKTEELFSNESWFTRYDYKYDLTDELLICNNTGNLSSDFFHQENRWKCDSINAPSPYRTWKEEKFRLTLLNGLWTLKYKKVDNNVLRSCIGLRKYIASQFRPSAAKAIIDKFNASSVLDFSSGWGDRLSGFMASNAKKYVGIDPNSNLIDGYSKQIKLFNSDKQINLINMPAEYVIHSKEECFDLVFTSPPYFNIERYTQEKNQSWKKYKKVNDWLESFLFKAIENSWEVLKPNGHMIINISDVYSNHTIHKICDPMNDFISSLPNSKYLGAIGYEMRKRPNSGALKNKTGKFAEPMWVWKKM